MTATINGKRNYRPKAAGLAGGTSFAQGSHIGRPPSVLSAADNFNPNAGLESCFRCGGRYPGDSHCPCTGRSA